MYVCMYYVCMYVRTYECMYFVIVKNGKNTNKKNGIVREYILKYLAKREANE